MPARLLLFGSPSLEGDGASTAWPFERRSQLVAHLALRRTWVGRNELTALLWPQQPAQQGFGNLRKTLFRMQGLPWGRALESQAAALRYVADTDVHAFEAAVRERRLADATRLYRGRLLTGFDEDGNEAWTDWLRFERDRLHALWRSAALDLLAAGSDPLAGIELSARLLETDPLDEAALRAQMTLLAQQGQASRAREAYRAYVARLDDELGIGPGPELQAFHDALGKPAGTPGAAAAARPDGPRPDDGFVGRTAERRQIAELMARDDVRLLSITGPGGVGKTRLARRVLQELQPLFPQGAVFVALEDVDSIQEMAAHVAGATGVRLQGRQPPLQQLSDALHERNMLLVLDNFEQLVADAARLQELLDACPRLKLIVTSRVRLGLAGEQLFAIEGLPCPEAEDADRLEAFDAAQLFVAAARRVEPALQPAAEADAIVEICRCVDGLPLALELVASFARLLSCAAIAAELREGTELLRSADPSRPARHASIEVVFEHSWRRLAPAERKALTRLALFRGGFTAATARSVAGVSMPVLAALSDKSLLRKEGSRNHLHPLVQQLALQRLGEGADRSATAAAHAGHFLRWLAGLRSGIRHAEPAAMREAETEFENICSAWRWTVQHGPASDLARAAISLMNFCHHRGRLAEGLALLEQALAGLPTESPPDHAGVLASAAALTQLRLDRYTAAEGLALQANAAARKARDTATQLQCATVLGASCARLGRLPAAKRWFQRALLLARQAGEATAVAQSLDNLAYIERSLGHLDAALELYRQALLQHREVGDIAAEALCLNNLGVLHFLRTELEPADEMLRAALQLCTRHGLPTTRCMVENNLAELALRGGEHEAALLHGRAALDISLSTGQRAMVVEARQVLLRVALHAGDLPAARQELCAAVESALAIGRPSLLVHCVWRFADLLAAQGEEDCARLVLTEALRHPAIVGVERTDAQACLTRWGGAGAPDAMAAVPPLEELAHRIVVETALAHGPLLAHLRRGRAPPHKVAA